MNTKFVEEIDLFRSFIIKFKCLWFTYVALNISALWSVSDCPTKLNTKIIIKLTATIPIHIIISEILFKAVNALNNYKKYYINIRISKFIMHEFIIIEIELNVANNIKYYVHKCSTYSKKIAT